MANQDEGLIEAVVQRGWERAQYASPFPEITDAYRYEPQIRAALRIGAEEALKIARQGSHTDPLF